MFYYVKITRGDKVFFVVSPKYGVYELSNSRQTNTYLWQTAEDCDKDNRWKHLIQIGDLVEYVRTYKT
jgi:hypothetical protein